MPPTRFLDLHLSLGYDGQYVKPRLKPFFPPLLQNDKSASIFRPVPFSPGWLQRRAKSSPGRRRSRRRGLSELRAEEATEKGSSKGGTVDGAC